MGRTSAGRSPARLPGRSPVRICGRSPARMPGRSARRRLWATAATLLTVAVALLAWSASTAAAHVIPSSTVQLAVGADQIEATVSVPVSDLAVASGLELADESQASIDDHAAAIADYLVTHVRPTSTDGEPWTVQVGSLTVDRTGDPATTGLYQQLTTTLTLTPPAGSEARSFELGYTAVVDKVATHTVIVTIASDQADPDLSPYQIGVIKRDTVTNTVTGLQIDLGATGSDRYQGFAGMVSLGMHHIAEGTDHQLFLLTLLLPAPLIAIGRRWAGPAGTKAAIRKITTITLAFTLGHSLTLALGALGVPSPQGLVEAMIAVSILVAAVHAIRPIFPGREALVAAGFGLIHGLAFSQTLRELDLTGVQLLTALLGFNLGIEAMQLIIVAAVLPPLILLARADRYRALRLTAAVLTAIAALGWLAARLGQPNPVAEVADQLTVAAVPVVVGLWIAAAVTTRRLVGRSGRQPGGGGGDPLVGAGQRDPDVLRGRGTVEVAGCGQDAALGQPGHGVPPTVSSGGP